MTDYDVCPVTKGSGHCVKFAGHPGRCRFARRIWPKGWKNDPPKGDK